MHETVARARFNIKIAKKRTFCNFLKMSSAKCARDCSESSISHKHCENPIGSDHFLKMRPTKCARDCSESSISHNNPKKLRGPVRELLAIQSFQIVHVNSFMSSHSFQFIRFNAFITSHSCQFINFNSVIHSAQFLHFISFFSIV